MAKDISYEAKKKCKRLDSFFKNEEEADEAVEQIEVNENE